MASKRKGISKRIRFEVFKRDGFACQYCGAKAPSAVLHIDHVEPLAKGGENEILNYITACSDCNLGKGPRELDDQSALHKQRAQLDDLNTRREQLRLMISWKDGLKDLELEKIKAVTQRMNAMHPGWRLNEEGRSDITKLVAKVPIELIFEAIDIVSHSIEKHWDGRATRRSVTGVVDRVARIATIKLEDLKNPGIQALYYIRGIARKRIPTWGRHSDWQAMALLKRAQKSGASEVDMTDVATGSASWWQFTDAIEKLIASKGQVREP